MQRQYFYIALVVSICLEYGGSDETTDNEENEEDFIMDHTFVALIDIVYTDGSKRSCTGAIIDDNVVVTAAHCFVIENKSETQPELTASFVVIGTKKMFDTGYEQYLPIERILTHPRFHGWIADIALVFTFADMTNDKPGTVIPLGGDKISTHIDTNTTIFSWGRYGDIGDFSTKGYETKTTDNLPINQNSCASSEIVKDEDTNENKDHENVSFHGEEFKKPDEETNENKEHDIPPLNLDANNFRDNKKVKIERTDSKELETTTFPPEPYNYRDHKNLNEDRTEGRELEIPTFPQEPYNHRDHPKALRSNDRRQRKSLIQSKMDQKTKRYETTTHSTSQRNSEETIKNKKVLSRYLASESANDEDRTKPSMRAHEKQSLPIPRDTLDSYLETIWHKFASTRKDTEISKKSTTESRERSFRSQYRSWRRKMPYHTSKETETTTETTATEAPDISFKSQYKNWRRTMPNQQNSLRVEIFSFINQQMCKRLIEREPVKNEISKEKDYVCYNSEDYIITEMDSGAPAVRRGQLVAVTVGGVSSDGDHVGIGMKLACYCSWIADNVPSGKNMTCCKNCCESSETKEKQKYHKKTDPETENAKRNKYLLR